MLSLDQIGWSDDILTAARVTNWQEFRDLFSSEVISPDEEITVGSQVILFTDLRGSTAMYRGIGDAPAYALVRDHFVVLTSAVRRHHGTVVKTIGDAVMACFSRVDEALEAIRDMNRDLPMTHSNQSSAVQLIAESQPACRSLPCGKCQRSTRFFRHNDQPGGAHGLLLPGWRPRGLGRDFSAPGNGRIPKASWTPRQNSLRFAFEDLTLPGESGEYQ